MRAALVVAVGLSLLAAPASAQQTDGLAGLLDTLAVLWSRGDAAALVAHGAEAGLDLEIHGESIGTLHGRRAAAALRQLFGALETVSVEAGSAERVVGAEDRAFGEFIWVVRMPGGMVSESNRIFVALLRENDEWHVSQIRILR